MANTVTSPNMNMPVPTVSQDPGPDWATNIDACLSIIDSHNHTSGQGVQITPSGININADLPMNINNLTLARSVRFSPQSGSISGASDLGCLYENGVDLYYIDGAGNQVRITQAGAVTGATGTITGLPSGTASASFAAGTFTFQSATNTPATLNVGSVIIGQQVASGKNVTVAASVSQPSNYNLTLPTALPTVQSAPVSDASGNLSFLSLSSGTYAPTLSAGAGGGTSIAADGPWFYQRVGNVVTVSGNFHGTSDSSTNILDVTTTLPINPTSTFSNTYDVAGVPMGVLSGLGIIQNKVFASTGTNHAEIIWRSAGGGANLINMSVVFTYSCA